MSEIASPLSAFPADLNPAFPQADLLWGLLEASLTGFALYTPLRDAEGRLIDFCIDLLNPAAQRILSQPARPGGTYLQHYPHTLATGVFAFHRDVYESGQPDQMRVNYQGDDLDNYFLLSARRVGEGLLVSFTDTADQPRTPVEVALREAQAAEQAARADAEAQRAQLRGIFEQAPAMICIFDGPQHLFQFVNPPYQALVGDRPLIGKPIAQAMPELAGQPIFDLLDRVYRTGEPFHATEMLVQLDHDNTHPGALEERYYNFIYQARRSPQGAVDGVLVFAYDVTPQVRARQQVQALHDAQQRSHAQLLRAQQQLEQLNQELETRVQERTRALHQQQAQLLAIARRQAHDREAFQAVFEQTPALIALLRAPNHRYEYVNPAYQAVLPGHQLVGLEVAAAVPELAEQGFVALLDRVYQTGETHYGTETAYAHAAPPGQPPQTSYYNFTYQAYREAGDIAGVSIFAFDVTEQVRARQERALREQQLHDLFEQAPVAIGILRGPDYVVEVANPLVAQLWGRTPAQVLGRALFEALPEVRGQGFKELLDGVRRSGEAFVAEGVPAELLRGDTPQTVYLNFVYQPLRDAAGTVTSVAAVATDVTEQVRARQASEASARQLRLVTDALPVLIGYLDRDLRYRFANRAYQPWFGWTPDDMLGRPIQEVAGEQAFPNIRPYLERALAGERVEFEAEMPFRPHLHKHIRTTYIPDVHEGTVQGLYTLVADITDQVEARRAVESSAQHALALARELATANAQLTRTNVDLDNFIYTASHDLRQPIANIEGLLYELRSDLPTDVAQGGNVDLTLRHMVTAVDRFKRTIDHLTDVTKLQKEFAPDDEALDLAATVEDVCQDLAPRIKEAGARLWVEVSNFPPVQFSEKNLRSVVYNLLSNALKYRSPHRTLHIDIRAHVRERHTVLEVHDNGLGLADDQLPRLFRMFQRFHDHVEGTGIGLYMVKRMVENAGGRLEVHSQLGAGSTFFVHLPHVPGS